MQNWKKKWICSILIRCQWFQISENMQRCSKRKRLLLKRPIMIVEILTSFSETVRFSSWSHTPVGLRIIAKLQNGLNKYIGTKYIDMRIQWRILWAVYDHFDFKSLLVQLKHENSELEICWNLPPYSTVRINVFIIVMKEFSYNRNFENNKNFEFREFPIKCFVFGEKIWESDSYLSITTFECSNCDPI